MMLIHIVCWKYGADIAPDIAERHRSMLEALKYQIAEIRSFDVGADILHLSRSYDTGLVAHFDDLDALDRYTEHPEHQRVAAFGREISENVVSVDFVTASDE